MELEHDTDADAVYVHIRAIPYAGGLDLDDDRRIDYGDDGLPIGIELLSVSAGVNVAGLPHEDELAKVLGDRGIAAYRLASYTTTTSAGGSRAIRTHVLDLDMGPCYGQRNPSGELIEHEVTV